MSLRTVVVVVLDSCGIGGAPDAALYGDEGSATIPHVAEAVGGLKLDNLESLGLGNVAGIKGVTPSPGEGAFGAMNEVSAGKDTTTGHWEIAGIRLERPFPTYPQGFPEEVIRAFEEQAGVEVLGNKPASGTVVIEELGPEHMRTGKPIVYTSADSVFQIAAHVDVIPLPRLYELCRIARSILTGEHAVGRVIARPFRGEPGHFVRTPDRHDFSLPPPGETLLDRVTAAGLEVRAVGKIADIFSHRGITHSVATGSNEEGIDATLDQVRKISRGLVFTNLVDFDQAYGHRNDPVGYAQALEAFDRRLPEVMEAISEDACLFITADHGNDPTTPSTDHSRERVPVLVWGRALRQGVDLGVRPTFADLGATAGDLLGVGSGSWGTSFRSRLEI